MRSEKIELAILDIEMPGLNGLDVLRIIKTDSSIKDVKIVILTGSNGHVNEQTAYSLGCDKYIKKPFRIFDVIETINSILPR